MLDFSLVFQWRGPDLISDLKSLNKKTLVILIVVFDELTSYAKFQNLRSSSVCPRDGKNLTYSIDLIW